MRCGIVDLWVQTCRASCPRVELGLAVLWWDRPCEVRRAVLELGHAAELARAYRTVPVVSYLRVLGLQLVQLERDMRGRGGELVGWRVSMFGRVVLRRRREVLP